MTVRVDPEQNETRALFSFVDLDGRRVLEIGCGDGRLTWQCADRAAHVTAIEPFAPAVARARENLPRRLASRVTLCPIAFDEFYAATAPLGLDVAIFSWSLCCMEPDDKVPALEQAHRLVGPGGSVVDIHPVPGTATVEVYRSGEVVFADSASASDGEGEVQADAALAQVVARGLFAAERRAEFDFRVYASSPRELATSSRRPTRTRVRQMARCVMRTRRTSTNESNGSPPPKEPRQRSPTTSGSRSPG